MRDHNPRVMNRASLKERTKESQKGKSNTQTTNPSREVARCRTSNAKCPSSPHSTDSRRLSERSALARSEFCRGYSKARFWLPFARKQKVTPPPGGTPGTGKQPPSRSKKSAPSLKHEEGKTSPRRRHKQRHGILPLAIGKQPLTRPIRIHHIDLSILLERLFI